MRTLTPIVLFAVMAFGQQAVDPSTKVRNCVNFVGANFGAKALAAMADGPSTGVVADCRGILQTLTSSADFTTVSTPTTMLMPLTTVNFTENTTFPENMTVEAQQGAILCPAVGKTLTISGQFIAHDSQHFCSTGTIVFTSVIQPINPDWWPGSDIGASLNLAYAAAPKGARLMVKGTPSARQTSTPIVFATNGKPVLLECDPGNGTKIEWTGSGSSIALTIDWGTGEKVGVGVRNCWFRGPSKLGSTVGISAGLAAGNGAEMSIFEHIKVEAFGTGMKIPNSLSFLPSLYDVQIGDNGVALDISGNLENFRATNSTFYSQDSHADDCIKISGGGDYHFENVSFDVCQINVSSTNAIVGIVGGHAENLNSVNWDTLPCTDTNPIVCTWAQSATQQPHGFWTGDLARFYGGTGAWAAVNNATGWSVTRIDENTFSIPVNGIGFGAVTGTLRAVHYYDFIKWNSNNSLVLAGNFNILQQSPVGNWDRYIYQTGGLIHIAGMQDFSNIPIDSLITKNGAAYTLWTGYKNAGGNAIAAVTGGTGFNDFLPDPTPGTTRALQIGNDAASSATWRIENTVAGGEATLNVKDLTHGTVPIAARQDSVGIGTATPDRTYVLDVNGLSVFRNTILAPALTLNTTPLGAPSGGSGGTSFTANGVLFGGGTGAFGVTSLGGANTVLTGTGGAPAFSGSPTLAGLTLNVNALGVPSGGTGQNTLAANGVLYGAGTSGVGVAAAGTDGQFLAGNTGSSPGMRALGPSDMTGGVTGTTVALCTSAACATTCTITYTNGIRTGGTC